VNWCWFLLCIFICCRSVGAKSNVRKVVGSHFIIVSGNLTYQIIEDFLAKFFHPIHNKGFPSSIMKWIGWMWFSYNTHSFFLFRFAGKETELVHFVLHCIYDCISSLDCTHGLVQTFISMLAPHPAWFPNVVLGIYIKSPRLVWVQAMVVPTYQYQGVCFTVQKRAQ
jgi:hypothetical protein